MGVVYIPVVAVFSSVFLGIFASIVVGVGVSTNRFARRFWRGTQWKRVKRRMRFVVGFIAACGLSIPILPFFLLRAIGRVLVAASDYAVEDRAWSAKIVDLMDAVADWEREAVNGAD